MQPGRRRFVVVSDKRMTRNIHFNGTALGDVVGPEMSSSVVDDLEGAQSGYQREEHVLGRDHHRAAADAFESLTRLNLRKYVEAAVRRRRPFVFLRPTRGQGIGQVKVRAVV